MNRCLRTVAGAFFSNGLTFDDLLDKATDWPGPSVVSGHFPSCVRSLCCISDCANVKKNTKKKKKKKRGR